MQLQGKIKMISETQTFGSNGFRKREMVITTEEKYYPCTRGWIMSGVNNEQT